MEASLAERSSDENTRRRVSANGEGMNECVIVLYEWMLKIIKNIMMPPSLISSLPR
jgi:hypothetical protein